MSDATMFRRLAAALSDNPRADMAVLVAASGVSRATLYRNVGNRDAVVVATARFAVDALSAAVAHIGTDDAPPRAVFSELIQVLVDAGPLYRFLGHLDPDLDPSLRTRFDAQATELRALIVHAQQVGALRAGVSDWWVAELLDSVVWMAWSGVAEGELARKHAAALAFDTFWRAVAADEATGG